MKESYGTLSQTINGLKNDGYPCYFNVVNGYITCPETEGKFSPKDFKIDKTYRFEGATNPADESILYAISSVKHKVKGVLINGYGISANSDTNDLVKKLKSKDI